MGMFLAGNGKVVVNLCRQRIAPDGTLLVNLRRAM